MLNVLTWVSVYLQPNSIVVDVERGGVGKAHTNNNNQYGASGTSSSSQPEEAEKRTALIYLKKAIAAVGFLVIAACVVLLWVFMGAEFGIPGLIIALAILLVVTGAWRHIWIVIVTTPRDVK